MSDLTAFRDGVSELERIQAKMAGLSKCDEADWRRGLIDLRRQLQSQISRVATVAKDCDRLVSDQRLASQVRDALSHMRSTLALHQADWPAVAIDPESLDYRMSVESVRTANRAFLDLAKQVLVGR